MQMRQSSQGGIVSSWTHCWGVQSAEMSKSFHPWKHSSAEQLLREVKCFHCIVPSRILKAADFDLWKTVSEDAASAACKTLNAAPYEHYPSPPIKSHRNIPFPNLGGWVGGWWCREKMHKSWASEASETLSQVKVNWAKQIKPHSLLNWASSSTAPKASHTNGERGNIKAWTGTQTATRLLLSREARAPYYFRMQN